MGKKTLRKYGHDLASAVVGGFTGAWLSLEPIMMIQDGAILDTINVGLNLWYAGCVGLFSAAASVIPASGPDFNEQRYRRRITAGALSGLVSYSLVLGGYVNQNPDKIEARGIIQDLSSLVEEVKDDEGLKLLFRN